MKVSVVIPAYNEEKFIARTIEAVLAQKYSDFEVIVVDNASTDATTAIAKKFPVLVVHEPKKGLLHARDCGRRAAHGSVIANIDADCLPEVDWLSRGVAHFKNQKVVAVSGPYDYYDLSRSLRLFFLLVFKYVNASMNTLLQLPGIKLGGVLIGGNTFIRKDILEKAGYDTSIEFYGEDSNTAKRVSKYGHIIFDTKLVMKTSGRRYIREGVWTISWKYFINFFTSRK